MERRKELGRQVQLNIVQKNEDVQILDQVVVPNKFYRRIDTGVAVLNEIFGGQEMPGILPGATILFTGDPGAGKSTLAIQVADLIQRHSGRSVLYNVGEENRYMVKMRADRLGLKKQFAISGFDDVEKLIDYCEKSGVEFLVQDSIQSLHMGDLDGNAKIKALAKRFTSWKEKSDVTALIIGHSTKSGRFAGPNEMKHDVDVHAHLKDDRKTGNRVLMLEKNRFGPAYIPYEFTVSATGIDFQQLKEVDENGEETEKAGKAADRRDRICNFIKDKLLAGEKISGYCYERLDQDCSGGYWRGMIARAVKELERDGHKLGELRDGPGGAGRAHVYVVEKRKDAA